MPVLSAPELDQKLDEVVRRLRAALSPTTIYLFGSYAYGQPHAGSDLDLLVVVDDTPLDAYSRDAAAYQALIGVGAPKDVMVYTRSEFDQRSNLPVSFERTVREKGRIIYAR